MEAGRTIKRSLQLSRHELMVAYTSGLHEINTSGQIGQVFWR